MALSFRVFLKSCPGVALALAAALWAPAVLAQTAGFPSRTIRLISPAPPGGESDITARLLADGLQTRLHVPVIVENRQGAGISVGTTYVAKAAPDGYTLLVGGSGMTVSPSMLKGASNPVTEFTPISTVLTLPFYLAVRSDARIHSLAELSAWDRASGGNLNYGSSGPGTIPHFQMEMLKTVAKFNALHVPYRGSAPALTALLAGDVQMAFVGTAAGQYLKTGKLRALGVAMSTRTAEFPDVPAIPETFPAFNSTVWAAVLGPANMPADVVKVLNAAVSATVADPVFAAKIAEMGGQVASSTPEELSRRLRSETARYGELAASLGIKPE